MKLTILMGLLLLTTTAFAQKTKKNVRYEYKKVEKFDFDEIGVEGESGSPGDISINPRGRSELRNKLPERTEFNKEMKKGVDGIR